MQKVRLFAAGNERFLPYAYLLWPALRSPNYGTQVRRAVSVKWNIFIFLENVNQIDNL